MPDTPPPSTGTGTRVGDLPATCGWCSDATRTALGIVACPSPSLRKKEGGGGPWESTALMCGSVWNTVPCSRRKRVTVATDIRKLGLRYFLKARGLLCQQSLVPNTERILAQHIGLVNPLGRKKSKFIHNILTGDSNHRVWTTKCCVFCSNRAIYQRGPGSTYCATRGSGGERGGRVCRWYSLDGIRSICRPGTL